jgi:hypothetical protein
VAFRFDKQQHRLEEGGWRRERGRGDRRVRMVGGELQRWEESGGSVVFFENNL